MTDVDGKYREELILALRRHGLSGRQVGEVVAEVEAHLGETGADPVDAFGAPRDYAAQVAAQLGPGRGSRPAPADVGAVLAACALALAGTSLLIDGLTAGGQAVTVTAADVASLLVLLTVLTAGAFGLVRVVAATTSRAVLAAVVAGVVLAQIGAILLTRLLPGDDVGLVTLPPWAGITLGAALLVAMAALLGLIRRDRITGPWD
ncbi:hypothetical protein B0I33_11481 [Prauserella shujinwangii]|uniref:Uncharacterized protein n=1 Tax=Prauserella shujinwangii TaxID=1453103 RepID=A0A2T0LKY4_9PSEU|nr:hypothetical protein [Prauserella shujinwangii]PRX43620.1 hypothetical protein B0I33_11481 [Prauserella shujinwangii]